MSSAEPMTPTIRVIIADDEALARRKLRIFLASEPGVHVVAESRDGKQTLEALKDYKPDLLLLDVQMPDADGFQVLKAIPENEMPFVIFTTAYDHYAIRAFEAHAMDYLLKPFDRDRLHQAIERTRMELLKAHDHELTHKILNLLSNVKENRPVDRRLIVKAGGRVIFLDLDEIDWVEAAANYVKLNVGKDSYLLREAISRLAERLDPSQFVRIHRSTIVNVRKIKELQPCNSGEYIVVLKSGKELSCSRGHRTGLQQLIEQNS
jgi:two-component system, LytTR family, response regulator